MSLRAAIEARANALWYDEGPPPAALRALSSLYGRIADRRAAGGGPSSYQSALARASMAARRLTP